MATGRRGSLLVGVGGALSLSEASGAAPTWSTIPDKHIDPGCTSDEYRGDLGTMTSQACVDALEAGSRGEDVNYAVFHDDHCYICSLERGGSDAWQYRDYVGALSVVRYTKPPPPAPPPPPPAPEFDVGGLHLKLWADTFTVRALNVSVPSGGAWGKANNFSFVREDEPRPGCHALGDITIRVQPALPSEDLQDVHTWAMYSSASAEKHQIAPAVDVSGSELIAHDLTSFLNNTSSENPFFHVPPVQIVRSYAPAPNGNGFLLRFNVTNTWAGALRLGGLGMSMPSIDTDGATIEQSVWHDPHVGGDHGFVEWVRAVLDERTLLAVPSGEKSDDGFRSRFEAWRPIMENTCGGKTWEFTTHSEAWAAEWAEGKQYPYLWMSESLNSTGMWPEPKTPWPAWFAHDTVPVTDHEGVAQPWNKPTSLVLGSGESVSLAVHFLLAEQGPRTRDAALAEAGKAVVHAVPGYVVSPEMTTAQLFVQPPPGTEVASVVVSDSSILKADLQQASTSSSFVGIPVQGLARGRCRVSVVFSDGTTNHVHYMVLPAFNEQVRLLGHHWATDSWLPRDYPDPFGRSASVMPYDRERREIVLDESRAYDVGLSDDAGGGNPLGFAMKVGHAPVQDEVTRIDDFIKWTLYGVKPDTALPPLKSLQIRDEDEGDTDGIRMTMYYYDDAAHPSGNSSGHFDYDYKMADHCGLKGIEGGPNWCMSENNANATGRVFNFPHHTASYYAMYRVARNHDGLQTCHPWQWYLERAAKTAVKFGSPSTGVMDGTIFREVMRSLQEEAAAGDDDSKWATYASKIEANMRKRAEGFASLEYPYGSEFAFDTTGQEEVVVWLSHFADDTNNWNAAAKRTLDHILSYMRSSPTWAYHGGSRSWGDIGNGGKWMVTSGTGFETRGNMHYRSGLNMIPLIEWYRANPDDAFLLEVSMGAISGQMANIDEHGAPSMMIHMQPHVLDYDPRSGDFGLGFFGHSLEAGAYLVQHPELGTVCYLCDLQMNGNSLVLAPRDSYRQRTYLEPLGLYLVADAGLFETISLDLQSRKLEVTFATAGADSTFSTRRLRVSKEAATRPGHSFEVVSPGGAVLTRGAYEVPASVDTVVLTWQVNVEIVV